MMIKSEVYVLLFVLVITDVATESVRYCDGRVDLLNRTDESELTCRFPGFGDVGGNVSLPESCQDGNVPGFTCLDQCVPHQEWCTHGTSYPWTCGSYLRDYDLCRNSSAWSEVKLCHQFDISGVNSSEFEPWEDASSACLDDLIEFLQEDTQLSEKYCINKKTSSLDLIKPNQFICKDRYGSSIPVCPGRCDRVLDGCLDDIDEIGCSVESHLWLLLGWLLTSLVCTILLAESVLYYVQKQQDEDQEVELEARAKINTLEDEDFKENMDKVLNLIRNPGNWQPGSWKQPSNIFKPKWLLGQFEPSRLDELKKAYIAARKSTVKPSPLSFLVSCLLAEKNETLQYDSCALVFQQLEPCYVMANKNGCVVDNSNLQVLVDIQFRKQLEEDLAAIFYGIVYPYFDPGGWIYNKLLKGIVNYLKEQLHVVYKWVEYHVLSRVPHPVYYCLKYELISYHLDLLQDIFIAVHVTYLYQTDEESKFILNLIVVCLWMTTFIAGTIYSVCLLCSGGMGLFGGKIPKLSKKKKFLVMFLFFLAAPISPAIVIYLNIRLRDRIKENRGHFESVLNGRKSKKKIDILFDTEERFSHLISQENRYQKELSRFYRLEANLESAPQVILKTGIILLAASRYTVPWASGLEAVFDTHKDTGQLYLVLFYLSTGWSMLTIINDMFTTFLYWKSYSVGDLGKVLVYVRILVGVCSRMFVLLLSTASYVGIFGFLTYYVMDSGLSYSDQVWTEYKHILEKSGDYDWYVLMNLKHLITYIVLGALLHVLLVAFVKRDRFSTRSSFMKMLLLSLQHSCTTLIVPVIYKDWDSMRGTCRKHFISNWKKVRSEFVFQSMLNLCENLMLTIPPIFTAVKNLERYNAMPNHLPEESSSYQFSMFVLFVPLMLVLLSACEILLFIIYNKFAHPWSQLIQEKNESAQNKDSMSKSAVQPPTSLVVEAATNFQYELENKSELEKGDEVKTENAKDGNKGDALDADQNSKLATERSNQSKGDQIS